MNGTETRNNKARDCGIPWLSLAETRIAGGLLLAVWCVGCGSGTATTSATSQQIAPQTYLAPPVAGSTNSGSLLITPQTYTFDDVANSFTQTTYSLDNQDGPQIITTGVTDKLSRGLLKLGVAATYNLFSKVWTENSSPLPVGWAFEMANQTGGLMQLPGQPVAPLVAATACPNSSTPQTYLFVTIPGPYIATPETVTETWTPQAETAFGSADVSASGGTVNFNNIQQFTLPSVGGTGTPTSPSPASVVGTCGTTFYGNTISVPAQLTVTTTSRGQVETPPAIVGIGPSGLLVESNGNGQGIAPIYPPYYETVLGAGTGAVGLPKPTSAINTSDLLGAQYLGFVYGAGINQSTSSASTGWTSTVASFGFTGYPTLPSACSTFAAQTGALVNGIYGGDFSGNNPSASPDGYGTCDFAIDLGMQDSANYGLYPNAKVWMSSSFVANTSSKTYQFPAVAIAGQLQGKFAIFLIGFDSSQPWGIYLLQSN